MKKLESEDPNPTLLDSMKAISKSRYHIGHPVNSRIAMKNHHLLPARARAVLTLLVLPLAFVAIGTRAFAQANPNPPERLAYQGFLVDANGIALATNVPKNYDVIFRIWNDPSASAVGNRLWTEQQTVTVDKGYFSVVLGEGSSIGEARPALSTVFTNSTASDRWIALTVKGIGTGGSDANILPRLRLITSPYAFLATKAISVDGAGVTSGTVSDSRLSTNVALRAGGNTFSGNQIINNSLGIGTSPSRPLTVNGTGNNGISLVNNTASTGKPFAITVLDAGQFLIKDDVTGSLQFWMDKINSSFSLIGGNVGAGTTTPDRPLSIRANNTVNGEWLSLKDNNDVTRWHLNNESGGLDFAQTSVADNRLFLSNNGNVGIGTGTPQAKLHVSGGIQLDSSNQFYFADGGQIMSFDGNHRILFRRSENKLELREYGDLIFSSGATASNETARAVLLASGNMGIGTNSPQAKLHVAGAMRVEGTGNFLGSNPYLRFSDERSKNTEGGTANTGINARTFNTESHPQFAGSLIINSTNISLSPGTYQCRISAPAYRVNQHQARLRISGGITLLYGTSEFANSSTIVMTHSLIEGQFTLTGSVPVQLVVEHYVTSGNPDNGLGTRANASWTDFGAVEVYTVAEFWKLQ
jgi:hypothetical protein